MGAGRSAPSRPPQLCVQDNYRQNPFHNFRHCFCVAQMMYSMVWLCGLQVGLGGPFQGAAALYSRTQHPPIRRGQPRGSPVAPAPSQGSH